MDDVKRLQESLGKQMQTMNEQAQLQRETGIYDMLGMTVGAGADIVTATHAISKAPLSVEPKPKAPAGALARFKKK